MSFENVFHNCFSCKNNLLSSLDPHSLGDELAAAETFIRLAPMFKTTTVKLSPGPPGSADATPVHWHCLEEALIRLIPLARQVGVRLAFETHMRHLTDTLTSSQRLLALSPADVVGLTVDFSNLAFAGDLYSVPRRERETRAKDLLRQFDLYERRGSKVKTYSRGMKRRLTIAMALVHHPAILFLDEPTTALDARSAIFVRDLIQQLKDEGVTIFLITHYIEEADQLCDRVAIINQGEIVEEAEPGKLINMEVRRMQIRFKRSVDVSSLTQV